MFKSTLLCFTLLATLPLTFARVHPDSMEDDHDHSMGHETSIYEYYNSMESGLSGGNFGRDIFPGNTNKVLRERNIQMIHQGKKEIVITVDDGPTKGVTDRLLQVLKKHGVQATFFVLGHKVPRTKSILEQMVADGHIVGNHSMEHKNIGQISGIFKKKKIKEAIIDAHKNIEPYMVNSPKWYFRAPYGSWQSRAATIVNETEYGNNYYGPLLWDIGGDLDASLFKVKRAADWGCWSKGWSVRKCLKGYINETEEKKGGVVLFHDLKSESVDLIDQYITHFKQEGYKFISLDDLDIR